MITYDLRAPGKNYQALTDYLEGHGTYWHALGSVWFVISDKKTAEVRDEVRALGDANDKIIVVDVSGDQAAWRGFREDENDWFLKYLTQ